MAKVPTYTAEANIPAGGTGPQASPAAYAAPARAMGQLGETIASVGMRTGLTILDIQEKRKAQDESIWLQGQGEEVQRKLDEWEAQNKNDPDIYNKFNEYSNSLLGEVRGQAKSQDASKRAENMVSSISNNYRRRMLEYGERTRFSNLVDSQRKWNNAIVDGVNSRQGDPGPALDMIGQGYDTIKSWGLPEPEQAKLRSASIKDIAIGTAAINPEFARLIVERSNDFDPESKAQLLKQIDNYQQVNNKIAELNFENELNKTLDVILTKNIESGLPSDDRFKQVYGKDWQYAKARAQIKFDDANTVARSWNQISDTNSSYQREWLNKNFDSLSEDSRTKLVQRIVLSEKEQQGPNAVGWQKQNNQEIQKAFEFASVIQDPEFRAEATRAANQLLIKYQGRPPADVTDPKERAKYLGRIEGQFNLLSKSEADKEAYDINAMAGPRLNQYMQELSLRYPDPKQFAIVWNDIVTISQGSVRAEIQFASVMPDQRARENYLDVIQELKEKPKLTDVKRKELEDQLSRNDLWKQFDVALNPGRSAQRKGETTMFENAIISYAQNTSDRLGPQKAIDQAVDTLIKQSWGSANVNGQWLLIQRKRSEFNDKPPRTDDEVADIGQKLSLAISMVPMDQISPKNPAGGPSFPNAELIQDPTKKLNEIQNTIRSAGFWYMNQDGQGAQLFIMDAESGLPFPLLDKNGEPFSVDFDKINATPLSEFGVIQRVSGPAMYPSMTGMMVTGAAETQTVASFPRLVEEPGFIERTAAAQVTGAPAMIPSRTGMTITTQPMTRTVNEPKAKINMPAIKSFWENLSK